MEGLRLSNQKKTIVQLIINGWAVFDGSDRDNKEILTDIIENDIEII